MYGLLSAVVKEIKSLRGMFGIGGSKPEDVCLSDMNISNQTYPVAQKTQPEVNITVTESKIDSPPQEVIMVNLTETVDAKQKIVVSDDESDSDEDSESSEFDLEEDPEEDEDQEEYPEEEDLDQEADEEEPEEDEENQDPEEDDLDDDEDSVSEPEPTLDLDEEYPEDMDVDVKDLEAVNVDSQPISVNDLEILDLEDHIENYSEIIPVLSTIAVPEPLPVVAVPQVVPSPVVPSPVVPSPVVPSPAPLVVDVSIPNVFTLDALRKMNVNQLKTVALQLGVTTDTSKLKRPELIALINTHK
jgi:cobalamin biosynthesis protein CobT